VEWASLRSIPANLSTASLGRDAGFEWGFGHTGEIGFFAVDAIPCERQSMAEGLLALSGTKVKTDNGTEEAT
jgi:hypothetical protein